MTGRRLTGIDAARGIALFGMMSTHILPLYDPETGDPTLVGLVFSGRSSALFAVVAGIGLALLTGGSTPGTTRSPAADRRGIAMRALIIAVVGLALGGLDTSIALILVHYALLFLLALPFTTMALPRLACWAAGWVLLTPVLAYLVRPWLEQNLSPADIPGNITWEHLLTPAPLLSDLLFTGFYPVLQWFSYVLVGMVIGRLQLRRLPVQLGLLFAGIFTAAATKFLSYYLLDTLGGFEELLDTDSGRRLPLARMIEVGFSSVDQSGTWWWLAGAAPHSGTTLDLLHTSGTAAAVVGLCLLLTRARPNLLLPLSAAGAMTLTLYSLHVWIMSVVDLQQPPLDPVPVFWIQAAVFIAIAVFLARLQARGPLELITSGASRIARDGMVPEKKP